MNSVKSHKKLARVRAATNGTSHQAELNAIAREHGHDRWGTFQKSLETASGTEPPSAAGIELEALIDAFETAHRHGRHLVVLRDEPDAEIAAVQLLKTHMGVEDVEGPGVAFVAMLTKSAVEAADSQGITLVTTGLMMSKRITHGNCMVATHHETLDHTNSLVSRRDMDAILNLPIGAHPDASRRSTRRPTYPWPARSVSEAWKTAGDLEAAWTMPADARPPTVPQTGFMPGWNVLNSVTMPIYAGHRRAYVERVADVLIPRDRTEYFRDRGREALVGFLLAEIAEARGRRDDPSIPAMMGWMRRSLDDAADMAKAYGKHGDGDHLGRAFRSRLRLLPACHEADAAREILHAVLATAPNERSGILGAMDAALLPFRNTTILGLNA